MPASFKKRISVAVEARHAGYLRSCLAGIDHEDFTVAPILSGYNVRGYWSSEPAFSRIGERVMVAFTADPVPIQSLIASGFGILASDVLTVQVTDVFN